MSEKWDGKKPCPRCGKVTYSFLHSCPMARVDRAESVDGGLRGTVADAVDFARECSEEWGVPVVVSVEDRRADLPTLTGRRAAHDGPTWIIRPRMAKEDDK